MVTRIARLSARGGRERRIRTRGMEAVIAFPLSGVGLFAAIAAVFTR